MNLVDLLIRRPSADFDLVIVIISRPSHSPVNRWRSVISGCRVMRMERSALACHSVTLSQYFLVALRLSCFLFLFLSLYFCVQCLRGDSVIVILDT